MDRLKIEWVDKFHIKLNGELKEQTPLSTWRSVYLTRTHVIKIDIDESEQCTDEIDLFEKVKGTPDEKYFAPILEYGEINNTHYIIQKRLRLKRNKKHTKELENQLDYLENKFGLWDLHDDNFTLQGNQVLVFDYGSYIQQRR